MRQSRSYGTTRSLQDEEIEAHRLLTQSMNLLADRIQKTETDFVAHLKKVEDRLDQIVDLTKTVAVLQNTTSQQTDNINDVRVAQREHFQKVDQSISRLHTRIEEAQNHQSDRLALSNKDTDVALKELKNVIEKSIEKISTLASNTDKELKAWLNRGWGAWALFVLVVGVASTGFYKWVDGLDKDRDLSTKALTSLVAQTEKNTLAIERLGSDLKEVRSDQKRIENIVSDLERKQLNGGR